MDTEIEKIITELYEIDPTLKEHRDDIRVLVTTLLEAKPNVVINENFILNLRKSLLNRASEARSSVIPTQSHDIEWWLLRLAPIGAVAILVLALLPEPQGSPTPYIPQSDMYESSAPVSNTRQMNTLQMDADESSESQMFKSGASDMTVSPESESAVQNPYILESVELPRAGFAVLQTNAGEIIGVSKLLPAGRTAGVYINLLRTPNEDEGFSVLFYIDDGDGIFSSNDELRN